MAYTTFKLSFNFIIFLRIVSILPVSKHYGSNFTMNHILTVAESFYLIYYTLEISSF